MPNSHRTLKLDDLGKTENLEQKERDNGLQETECWFDFSRHKMGATQAECPSRSI
jgi:hypothetical protein